MKLFIAGLVLGGMVIVLALICGDPTAFDCKSKCGPRGGLVVQDYWGLPRCLCQGAP